MNSVFQTFLLSGSMRGIHKFHSDLKVSVYPAIMKKTQAKRLWYNVRNATIAERERSSHHDLQF